MTCIPERKVVFWFGGQTLRRARAKNVLFFLVVLLVPAAASPQQNLPDAPDAVAAPAPASPDEGVPSARRPRLADDADAAAFTRSEAALAGMPGIGSQDWQTGIAEAPR